MKAAASQGRRVQREKVGGGVWRPWALPPQTSAPYLPGLPGGWTCDPSYCPYDLGELPCCWWWELCLGDPPRLRVLKRSVVGPPEAEAVPVLPFSVCWLPLSSTYYFTGVNTWEEA